MLSAQQLQSYLAWTPLQRLQQVEQIRQLLIAAAGADAGSYDRIRARDPSRRTAARGDSGERPK